MGLRTGLTEEQNRALFERMKEIASMMPNLAPDQMIAYHRSLMEDYAYYDTINTSYKKGRKEQAIEMARKLKEEGFDSAIITKCSGLSIEEIEAL